jgi:fructose-1,6-bisphosphatase/inositol monophosphatase family enzyme
VNELSSLLPFAQQAAVDAGAITLQYFQRDVAVEHKHDASPVTIADRSSERFLRQLIQQRFPDHAVLGEEDGLSGPEHATYRWVLDPIDGTKTFVRGVPLYGVLIGLLREDQPVLGVLHMPALNETVGAALGHGCRWNGNPCRVSTVDRLDRSLIDLAVSHADTERVSELAEARHVEVRRLLESSALELHVLDLRRQR